MRNLKKYSNHSGYSEDDRGLNYTVSICKSENHTHYDKPYDSKIAYLEIPTGAYIDTGYVPTNNTGYYVIEKTGGYGTFFGMRQSIYNNNALVQMHNDTNNNVAYGLWMSVSKSKAGKSDHVFEIKMNYKNSREIVINGFSVATDLPTFTSTPTVNVFIGAYNRAGTASTDNPTTDFYQVQITENENIVMNLIPVRIGTTGYMYDRISKRLFGNSGTGTFTLGPDV